ncbi:hypothetical protein ABZ923_25370 [Streptomyces sp. NPDC046881]|uniref:hypothetical protein n=1 Tax=Streptomyces sp. NPDC046881 TaxID=3155374 RepID=UPI0033E39B2B
MDMLNSVGRPCAPDAPPPEPVAADGRPPTAPVEPLPVDGTAPGGTGPAPDPSAPSREPGLSAVERCEGRLHAERITEALRRLADPAPDRVRAVLHELGYLDERVHGLRRTGATTRFLLDLRVLGGALCLDGSVTRTGAVVTAFAAPPTGPFTPPSPGQSGGKDPGLM